MEQANRCCFLCCIYVEYLIVVVLRIGSPTPNFYFQLFVVGDMGVETFRWVNIFILFYFFQWLALMNGFVPLHFYSLSV